MPRSRKQARTEVTATSRRPRAGWKRSRRACVIAANPSSTCQSGPSATATSVRRSGIEVSGAWRNGRDNRLLGSTIFPPTGRRGSAPASSQRDWRTPGDLTSNGTRARPIPRRSRGWRHRRRLDGTERRSACRIALVATRAGDDVEAFEEQAVHLHDALYFANGIVGWRQGRREAAGYTQLAVHPVSYPVLRVCCRSPTLGCAPLLRRADRVVFVSYGRTRYFERLANCARRAGAWLDTRAHSRGRGTRGLVIDCRSRAAGRSLFVDAMSSGGLPLIGNCRAHAGLVVVPDRHRTIDRGSGGSRFPSLGRSRRKTLRSGTVRRSNRAARRRGFHSYCRSVELRPPSGARSESSTPGSAAIDASRPRSETMRRSAARGVRDDSRCAEARQAGAQSRAFAPRGGGQRCRVVPWPVVGAGRHRCVVYCAIRGTRDDARRARRRAWAQGLIPGGGIVDRFRKT